MLKPPPIPDSTETIAPLHRALDLFREAHIGRRLQTQQQIERMRVLAQTLEAYARFATALANVSEDYARGPSATVLDLATLRTKRGAA